MRKSVKNTILVNDKYDFIVMFNKLKLNNISAEKRVPLILKNIYFIFCP